MDQVSVDKNGSVPTYTISMQGLAHINFDFKLFDSSGVNKANENQGVNGQDEFTFDIGVPMNDLNGRLLSLLGVAADFNGGAIPYGVTVTIKQGQNSTPMTVTTPPMVNGTANFFGLARFNVQ
jgi:hypothetical protein